jgi:hypothetical protein
MTVSSQISILELYGKWGYYTCLFYYVETFAIFANEDSCLRLVSAVVMEISDEWQSSKAYLSLSDDEFLD